jgi:hypothetical protein
MASLWPCTLHLLVVSLWWLIIKLLSLFSYEQSLLLVKLVTLVNITVVHGPLQCYDILLLPYAEQALTRLVDVEYAGALTTQYPRTLHKERRCWWHIITSPVLWPWRQGWRIKQHVGYTSTKVNTDENRKIQNDWTKLQKNVKQKNCPCAWTGGKGEREQYFEGLTVGSLVMSIESCAVGGMVGGGE